MKETLLRRLIRETLLLESAVPAWFEELIMSTDMDQAAVEVDPVTGRTGLDYFAEDNAKFLSVLEKEHGAGTKPIKNIGVGMQGTVWQLPDGNVMKIANDYGWGEKVYREYLAKIRDQHTGSPASIGDLRILDVFPNIWRNPKVEGEPYVPEHTQVAVIMDKVVPLDMSPELEDTMDAILVSVMLTLSKLCIPYLQPEYRDDAMMAVTSGMNDVNQIRHSTPLPHDLRGDGVWRYSKLMRNDFDVNKAQHSIAQQFLDTVDDQLLPESVAAIKLLPKIVGKQFHIRLNPNWWPRLKNAIANATREGKSDIKSDNFGIDSKGDIIPFDI
jgi:hypothetical protein